MSVLIWKKIGISIILLILCHISRTYADTVSSQSPVDLPEDKSKSSIIQGCGARSILVICQLLGIEATFDELYKLLSFTENGNTIDGLYEVVQKKGLKAKNLKLSMDELAKLNLHAIVRTKPGHFIVVDDIIGDNVRIIDPPEVPYILTKDEFQNIWDGNVLVVSKIQDKSEGKVPAIVFEELLYDFGEQEPDKEVTHIFRFWNGGNVDLVIDKGESSCGCTALLSSKTVQPGGVGEIEVTHDLKGRRGKDTQNVTIHTNDPNNPVINLTLTGIVKAEVIVSPDKIYFGNVNNKTTQVKNIYVLDPGSGKLEVTKAETGNKLILAQVQPAIIQSEQNKRIPIKVALNPGLSLGELTEKLTLYTNNDKKPKIEIPIEGNIVGDIVIFPEMVSYGIIKKDTQPTRKIILTSNNGTKFKILKVEKDTEAVTTDIKIIEEGKNYELFAQLNPNGIKDKINGLLKVYTDNKEQSVITIPIHGLIQD